MRFRKLLLLAVFAIQPPTAAGMHYTQSGLESGFWDRGSVVYAEVASVEKNDGNGRAVLRLGILSSISGPLDAANVGELSADVWYGLIGTSVRRLPEKGARVIAFVETRKDGTFLVPPSNLRFMPDFAAMFVVKNFDSPDVRKLINVLRNLRKGYEKLEAKRKRDAEEKVPSTESR